MRWRFHEATLKLWHIRTSQKGEVMREPDHGELSITLTVFRLLEIVTVLRNLGNLARRDPMRQLMASMVICLVVSIGSGSAARAAEPALSPLLTKDVVGLLDWREGETWEAYQKTASYRAFYETGLVPALAKQIRQGPWQQLFTSLQGEMGIPLQPADMEAILNILWKNGATLAIGLQERELPCPYVLLIARNCGEQFAALQPSANPQADEGGQQVEVAGRKLIKFSGEESEVYCWREETDLVLFATWGETDRRAEIERLLTAAPEARLVLQSQWTESWAGELVPIDSFRAWANITQIKQALPKFPEAVTAAQEIDSYLKIIRWFGVDQLRSVAYRFGYHGDHLISQWSVISDKAPMQWVGWGNQTITLSDLPPLPVDVTSFSLQVVNVARIYAGLRELEEDSREHTEQVASFIKGLGLPEEIINISQSVDEDTRDKIQLGLDTLGPAVCLYQDRQQQALPWGIPTLAIQVKDKDALIALLDTLPEEKWKRDDRWGCPTYHRIITTKAAAADSDWSLKTFTQLSTFAVCDGWLVLGIQPQFVQAFVLRSQGKLKKWSLEMIPAPTREKLPESFARISLSDPRAAVTFLGGLAPWAGHGAQACNELFGFTSQLQADDAENENEEEKSAPAIELVGKPSPLDIPPVELMNDQLFPNVSVMVLDGTTILKQTYGSTFVDRPILLGALKMIGFQFGIMVTFNGLF
jgi:hypothetical protein